MDARAGRSRWRNHDDGGRPRINAEVRLNLRALLVNTAGGRPATASAGSRPQALPEDQCSHYSTLDSDPARWEPRFCVESRPLRRTAGSGRCGVAIKVFGRFSACQPKRFGNGARRRRVSSAGAVKRRKTISALESNTCLKHGIIRHRTRKLHGNRVKLKACPERGSYKSQANDLHRSSPNAQRPKHDRLFSRRN